MWLKQVSKGNYLQFGYSFNVSLKQHFMASIEAKTRLPKFTLILMKTTKAAINCFCGERSIVHIF